MEILRYLWKNGFRIARPLFCNDNSNSNSNSNNDNDNNNDNNNYLMGIRRIERI